MGYQNILNVSGTSITLLMFYHENYNICLEKNSCLLFLCKSGKMFPFLTGEQNRTEIFFQEDYVLLLGIG